MPKYINAIGTRRPFSDDLIHIDVGGANLIITGGNGSGKTTLLREIHEKLRSFFVHGNLSKAEQLNAEIHKLRTELKRHMPHSETYRNVTAEISDLRKKITKINGYPLLTIFNYRGFISDIKKGLGVIEFFDAHRQANISAARTASSTDYDCAELNDQEKSNQIGMRLESHLVNLHVRKLFAKSELNDLELYKKIELWFQTFRDNLRYLLEDSSADIKFDVENFKFYIYQDSKARYTFQNLSSGYSSIFNVLSRLLMRAEYLRVAPSALTGIALIDELDAHLHVSLQRKILPFLTTTFSSLQFIVTTHSPFVLSSVENAVIYDLTKNEQIRNLSSYSYEAIAEAIFGVSSSSQLLENRVDEVSEILSSESPNYNRLGALLSSVAPDIEHMDDESKFFINRAIYLLRKNSNSDKDNV